ncbi:MAG TPA: DUF4149 domain-containing protein [Thermoanaerobaculia bacterium]|nr:DUF4149 domain-containing protein [Thermoanaerobaculia bacterium]
MLARRGRPARNQSYAATELSLYPHMVPNWIYLAVAFLYNFGLAVWIGGTLILGALVAPALFRKMERPEAGALFGAILRKFSRVRLVCLAAVIVGAACKHLIWETHIGGSASPPWIAIRWAAIAVMAAGVSYEVLFLERAIEEARNGEQRAGSNDRFKTLHRRAEGLVKLELLAAAVALLLN